MSSSLSVDKIRARIKHPILDADGHTLEFLPAVRDHVIALGGADMAKEFDQVFAVGAVGQDLSDEEKRALGLFKMTWWGFPARNTLDRATAHLPRLLYQRLDEIGLDYAIIYPTQGLGGLMMPSAETRQVFCRAFNHYYADEFCEFNDRMTPAALIPMQTPDEAVLELELGRLQCKIGVLVLVTHDRFAGAVQRQVYVAVDETRGNELAAAVDDASSLRNVDQGAEAYVRNPVSDHHDRSVLNRGTAIPVYDRGSDDGYGGFLAHHSRRQRRYDQQCKE